MRILLFLLSITVAQAASITGKVVGVTDGDTITVLIAANESVKVRLHGIDAPESKQAFGSRAKQELSGLVFGKVVRVEVQADDRYERTVGRVFVGKLDVNIEKVRRGFAWWYRAYAKKAIDLAAAETEAKNAGRGLWAGKAPVPPWEIRRTGNSAKVSASH